MQLLIVSDYITQARGLLQDTVVPFRYSDDDLCSALNIAWTEVSKIRPDIILNAKYIAPSIRNSLASYIVPFFISTSQTVKVPVPPQYQMAFLNFIVGFAQLRDTTDTQDQRAALFLKSFVDKLTGLPS